MIVKTSRFGNVNVTKDDLLHFPEGLLGFAALRSFVLLDDPNDEVFAWFQSCEDSNIAFPVLEPELFCDNYSFELSKLDLKVLQLEENSEANKGYRCFSIITIPEDPTQMTANLKAPIIINIKKRIARQCILQNNQLAIKEPIFTNLQQRVVQNPESPIKSQAHNWGVAVRIPDEGPSAT